MAKRSSTLTYSKEAERHAAKVLGGRRLAAGEWLGLGDVDVDGGWWLAQVKHKGELKWLRRAFQQIEDARDDVRPQAMPIVVLVEKPGRGQQRRTFVVVDADSWVAWNGHGDAAALKEAKR